MNTFHLSGLRAVFLLTLGLVVAAPAAHAQVPVKLSFALTATYQAPDVTSGPDQNITKSTVKTLKVTSATLITLTGGGFSPKATLMLDLGGGTTLNVGSVSVLDGTNGSTDESAFMSFTLNSAVYTGTTDSDKGTAAETYSAYLTVTFDDGNGNAGNVSGLFKIGDSIAALTHAQTTNSSPATETILMTGTVTGSGTVIGSDGNSDNAVFSGTITGTGKGATGT